jgi:hypothetical protein
MLAFTCTQRPLSKQIVWASGFQASGFSGIRNQQHGVRSESSGREGPGMAGIQFKNRLRKRTRQMVSTPHFVSYEAGS